MSILQNPPFEVGQAIESKSFSTGFRGAWFRGKIKDIARRRGHLEYSLEFIDFPDEKIVWTRAFQVPPVSKRKRKEIPRQLMVRPQYPLICHKKEIPDANSVHEVTVAIVGTWKVGDYVDWLADGCYWAGKVTKVLDNGKFQVDLPPPPLGEGSSYQVDCMDLRPSLDWSLEFGWSNSMQEPEESCPTARLIKPLILDASAGSHTNVEIGAVAKKGGAKKVVENIEPMSDQPLNIALSSSRSASLLNSEDVKDDPMMEEAVEASHGGMEQVAEANVPMDLRDDFSNSKANNSDGLCSSNRSEDALSAAKTEGETKEEVNRPGREVLLNSMNSDTFDAAVMDLEELTIRIKWLKNMLDGQQLTNDSGRYSWEVDENRHQG